MKNEVSKWYKTVVFITVVTGVLVLSFAWVDIPVVRYLHEHGMRQYRLLHDFQKIPKYLGLLFPFISLWAAYRWHTQRLSAFDTCLILASCSYVTALAVTYPVKFLFGRSLPQALIEEQTYGFHLFRWGTAYQSFPSGHTAVIWAVSTILWCSYPRLRGLAIVLCTLVMIGVLGRYDHFVSDVMAGALVGIGVGKSLLLAHRHLFAIPTSREKPCNVNTID